MAVDEPAPPAGAQHPSVVALIGARFGFSGSAQGSAWTPVGDLARRGFARRFPRASLLPSSRDIRARSRDGDPPCRRVVSARARHRRRSRRPRSSPLLVLTHDRVVVARASRLTTARPPPPSPSRRPPRSQVPRRARRQALAPRRAPGAVRDGRRGGAPNEAHARPRRPRRVRRRRRLRRAPRAPPTPTVAETRT